jgi:hypothetical protein
MTTLEEIRRVGFLSDRLAQMRHAVVDASDETALWIGAGISAKYAKLPTWTAFLSSLLKNIDPGSQDHALITSLIGSNRFALAAECLADLLGKRLFIQLASTFAPVNRSSLPDFFARSTIRDVITTNYDTALEARMPWSQTLSPAQDIEVLLSENFKIVKLHGSVATPESCVLSLTSYVRAYSVNMRWYLTHVFSSSSVIFLGCSMNPSEPCFQVLRLLKATGRAKKPHFAVMAVANDDEAKAKGKWLNTFGIGLIPYIPDQTHSFIDELFGELKRDLQSKESISHRVALARANMRDEQLFLALVRLWNLSHFDMKWKEKPLRRDVGDTFSEFFRKVLGSPEAQSIFDLGKTSRMGLPDLWDRWSELAIPTRKAYQGLERALEGLQAMGNDDFPLLHTKLQEFRSSISTLARDE